MAGVAAFAMLLVSGCGKDVTEPPPDIDIEPDVDPVTVQLVFPGLRAEATAASADSIPAIRETQLTDSFTVAFWDGNGQVFVPGPDDRVEINVGAGFRSTAESIMNGRVASRLSRRHFSTRTAGCGARISKRAS